jgi:hypothetical protein
VVKAAAWSVPAIVVATASPAAAAISGTTVITSATGSGAINVLGLTSTSFTVHFGGTSNTLRPAILTVSGPGGRTWSDYEGNVVNVKAGSEVHFSASVSQLVAIILRPTVTATFTDDNSTTSAEATVNLISIDLDLGRNTNSKTLKQQSGAANPAPTAEPTKAAPVDPAPVDPAPTTPAPTTPAP